MKNKPVSGQTAFVCKYRRRPSPNLGKKRSLCSHWVGTVGKAAKKVFSRPEWQQKTPAGRFAAPGGAHKNYRRSLPYFLLSSPPSLCPTFLFWSILIRQKNSLQYQTGVQIRRCASFSLKKTFWCFIHWSAMVSSWNNKFSQPLNAQKKKFSYTCLVFRTPFHDGATSVRTKSRSSQYSIFFCFIFLFTFYNCLKAELG